VEKNYSLDSLISDNEEASDCTFFLRIILIILSYKENSYEQQNGSSKGEPRRLERIIIMSDKKNYLLKEKM